MEKPRNVPEPPQQTASSREWFGWRKLFPLPELLLPREVSSPQEGTGKAQQEQLVMEPWGILSPKEEAALWLHTHLAELPAGLVISPAQTHGEDPGCMVDCHNLGGWNLLLAP